MPTFAITDLSAGQIVEIANSDRLWQITAIEKGWISLVEDTDGSGYERKVRAKQITQRYLENDSGSLELSAPSEATLDAIEHAAQSSEPETPDYDDGDDDGDDGELTGGSTMARQIHKYSPRYVKAKNASGTSTLITGDILSIISLYLDVPTYVDTARQLLGDSANKYSHLNPGQQRMNYGNRIRASVKAGKLPLAVVVQAIAYAANVDLMTQFADQIAAEKIAIDEAIARKAASDGFKAAAREVKAAAKAEARKVKAETKAAKAKPAKAKPAKADAALKAIAEAVAG